MSGCLRSIMAGGLLVAALLASPPAASANPYLRAQYQQQYGQQPYQQYPQQQYGQQPDRCVQALSGYYSNGATIQPRSDGPGIIVTVNPGRPPAYGTCTGNRLVVNFPDDHTISGVFDGRTIYWGNNTIWGR